MDSSALMRLRLATLALLLPAAVATADPRADCAEAWRLMDAAQFDRARDLLQDALLRADAQGDGYFAFIFARDLSNCHGQLGNNDESIRFALEALRHLDEDARLARPHMPASQQAFERCVLEGLLAKYHYYSHRVSSARQWHDRATATLGGHIASITGSPYDFMSGVRPAGLTLRFSVLIPRQLWFESMILESEARTAKALQCLDAAERYLMTEHLRRDPAHEDYYWKTLNRKAALLDFLGWLPDAIELDRRAAGQSPTAYNDFSIQCARINLNRNLSQYYGPAVPYLEEAADACAKIRLMHDATGSLNAMRMVNKMIFDLTHERSAATNLATLAALMSRAGLQMSSDYTERDQLEIQIRSAMTDGVEARLLKLIETYRDNGNRTGEVTLYRNYGDLCRLLGRYDDAVYLYTQAYELARTYGWHALLPRAMANLALAYVDKGDSAHADQWVGCITAHLRAHPEIPPHRQAAAMLDVADLQERLGRGTEALATRGAAAAYAAQNHVPDYWLAGLATRPALPAPAPARPAAAAARPPDGQPRQVVSLARLGDSARARFALADLRVATANLAELNPYYYLPLSCAIRPLEGGGGRVNFSVVSSVPCHIEVAEAATDEPICVDRQGDGAFDKEGDFVFQDADGNAYPDHTFAVGESVFEIAIRVYPTNVQALEAGEAVTVTVLVAQGDDWQRLAEDVRKVPRP